MPISDPSNHTRPSSQSQPRTAILGARAGRTSNAETVTGCDRQLAATRSLRRELAAVADSALTGLADGRDPRAVLAELADRFAPPPPRGGIWLPEPAEGVSDLGGVW